MAFARRARRPSGWPSPAPPQTAVRHSGQPHGRPAGPAPWRAHHGLARPQCSLPARRGLVWPRHSWHGAQLAVGVPVAECPFVSACAARDRCAACPSASACACPRRESLAVSTVVTARSLWMSPSFVTRRQPAAPLPPYARSSLATIVQPAQVAEPSPKPHRCSSALVVVLVLRTYPHPRVHSMPSGF